MSRPVSVGVIGCGYWGPNLIRNLRSLPGFNLTAVCDRMDDRLRHIATLYPEANAESDPDRLIRDRRIDAVVVATGIEGHYALAKACLLHGKHVLIEKPFADSSAHCRELIEISRQTGCTLMVGHTFLYSPSVREMKKIIQTGEIGDILCISCRRLSLGIHRSEVNVTWDLAPHDLAIALYLLEEQPTSVTCTGLCYISPGVEDVSSMCLDFGGRKTAIIHNSWLDRRKVREVTVIGSKGMITYDDVEPLEKVRIFNTRVEAPPHYDSFGDFAAAYHYGDVRIPYIQHQEPLSIQCQHFLDAIRTGARPLTDGWSGLRVVRILEAASKSITLGGAPVAVVTDDGSALNAHPRPITTIRS